MSTKVLLALSIGLTLLVFLLGVNLGYGIGKNQTVVKFEGVPEDAVIHFEVSMNDAEI